MIDYIEVTEMKAACEHAKKCTSIIRQWLPVEGRPTLSTILTMDDWLRQSHQACEQFLEHHPREGQCATCGPEGVSSYWREVCDGMIAIQRHYKWKKILHGNRFHSDCRSDGPPPPISGELLSRIDQAAHYITELPNEDPTMTFEEHCEKCESQGLGHMDTAAAWLASHPEEPRDCEQIKTASKNYRTKRNRERKQRGETGNPL